MWGKKKKPKLDENGKPIPVKLADKDKIFNNTYGDQDVTENKVNFTVAATYGDSMDPDDRMHYELLIKKIDKIINLLESKSSFKVTLGGCLIKKINGTIILSKE